MSSRCPLPGSGTLFPRHCWRLSDEFWNPDQVVCCATEDEQPVHFLQPSQLDLPQWPGLLQPPKALFDQPTAAQTDGIAWLPRGSAVQVAAAVLVVPGDVRGHIQFPYGAHEILTVIRLVGAHSDATCTALLLLGQHQQRGIALGIAISMSHHRSGDQPVAVLNQGMAKITQLRLLAVALL